MGCAAEGHGAGAPVAASSAPTQALRGEGCLPSLIIPSVNFSVTSPCFALTHSVYQRVSVMKCLADRSKGLSKPQRLHHQGGVWRGTPALRGRFPRQPVGTSCKPGRFNFTFGQQAGHVVGRGAAWRSSDHTRLLWPFQCHL